MFNEALITLSGYVATQPTYGETRTGVPTLSMRVAWTPRRFDRLTGEWADADTSFVAVQCYRKLAENAGKSLRKGDPVLVRGRLSVREYEDKNGARRNHVEVDASSVGHDLLHGVAQFRRVRPQTGMTAQEHRDTSDPVFAGGPGPDAFGAADLDAAGSGPDPAAGVGELLDDEAVDLLEQEAAGAGAPF